MYHSIDPEVDPYTISPERFADHIRYLKRHYGFARLSEVGEMLRGQNSQQRTVVLTFDDAFLDFFETAYPILAEYKIPSTVFVPTAFIGRHNEWDAALPDVRRRPLMNQDQLRTLWQTGLVDFGSHTVHHRRMSQLSLAEMREQATESKKALEDVLGVAVNMFAYPYGQLDDVSDDAVAVVGEAGYDIAVTTHWGAWNAVDGLLRLRRVYFSEGDTDRVIGGKVSGRYEWRAAKERVGHAVRTVRRRLRE